MDIVSVIAIVIAIISLTFSVIQWISRHRPYIGLVNLDWETVHGNYRAVNMILPDSIKSLVKNVGEAPANTIRVDCTVEAVGKGMESDKKTIGSIDLGVLFPGQEVEVILAFDMISSGVKDAFANGGGAVIIDSVISYKGIRLLRWHRKHHTQQRHIIVQAPKSWRTLAGGDYS